MLAFNAIALRSTGSIYFGSTAYIATVSDPALNLSKFSPETPKPALPLNTSRTVLFAAGDLSLSSPGQILQQDTNGFKSSLGTGGYVARSLTLDGYNGVAPTIIDLYLSLGSPKPVFGPAAALASAINLSSGRNGLYRVNTCVIGELGTCLPFSDLVVNIDPDQFTQLDLQDADPQDVEDPTITGAPNEEIWRKSK